MCKFNFWCSLLPILCANVLFGQNPDTFASLSPRLLSSSGFENDASGSLTFSVGFLQNEIVLEDQHFDERADKENAEESEMSNAQEPGKNISAGQDLNVFVESSVTDADGGVNISVYPNPFVHRLTLTIADFVNNGAENYEYALFDIAGNKLNLKRIENREEEIMMTFLAGGLYILRLYQGGKEIKSFRLLKTN